MAYAYYDAHIGVRGQLPHVSSLVSLCENILKFVIRDLTKFLLKVLTYDYFKT